jgi:hypothetical protein
MLHAQEILNLKKRLNEIRAARSGLRLGSLPALIFRFATIEAHRTLSCDFEILS